MKLKTLQKILTIFTSTRAAGAYFLLFAVAIGAATFIENDYGTSSAQELVFRSKWFEVLLFLFATSIVANVWKYRLIQQKKWASLCFHLSIIIILLGSAVTRYFGTEGMMHIREGETTNKYLSTESFLKFQVLKDGKSYSFDEPTYFSSVGSNQFEGSYQIGQNVIEAKLEKFLPNPTEKPVPSPNGLPMIKVVIAGSGGREEYYVKQGEQTNINGLGFNFTNQIIENAFNVNYSNEQLTFQTNQSVNQTVMATQKSDTLAANQSHPLLLRSLYSVGGSSFVIGDFVEKGELKTESSGAKIKNESLVGLNMVVLVNGKSQTGMITGRKGDEGQPKVFDFGNIQIAVSYGAKIEELPFSILCKDFILEKYPGTENPSSYASVVTLIDTEKAVNKDQRIFMNNILDYRGYRFFQSSFDQDEAGTYLSVNHDFWGTLISYIGYALLTIGLLLTFVDKKSRFSYLLRKLQDFQTQASVVIFTLISLGSFANEVSPISQEHAKKFGELVVQDHNGRVKPVNTYTSELLRKISRKESLFDLNSDQLVLSMILNPEQWTKSKIIQVPNHPEIKKILNSDESLVSYSAFFNQEGNYVLEEYVRKAQSMIPKDQGTFEKAIIKIDEKINIVNMIFSGSMFRLFPQSNDSTNTWLTPADLMHNHQVNESNAEARTLFMNYLNALSDGGNKNNFSEADKALEEIATFQKKNGGIIIPSDSKLNAELFLNKLDVFSRLKNFYGILSLILTITFLYTTVRKSNKTASITKYAFWLLVFGFVFHTIGLGLRWYISGRAPWSNGYESMIYIGWTTMLAGTFISRKSLGGLAATATLAATVLLVASMSWLDPEITPLVPVLKSYWLTIHVSLEAGSYGFLMLGAVIGMLNLLLMILMNEKNKVNTTRAIKELTVVSEIVLLVGLTMVSIGTYLGGVWANESWGRYWGWDAKETWALVTILVYAFILHMRFIPKLQGIYAYNFASLFGFATVIMTYLGVNYYLSGLHSYAAGDPVPIPSEVYYTTITLTILSILAYISYRKKMVSK